MENRLIKSTILSVGLMISGAIMFSAGAIDFHGNTWIRWTISLQTIGATTLLSRIVLGVISSKNELIELLRKRRS